MRENCEPTSCPAKLKAKVLNIHFTELSRIKLVLVEPKSCSSAERRKATDSRAPCGLAKPFRRVWRRWLAVEKADREHEWTPLSKRLSLLSAKVHSQAPRKKVVVLISLRLKVSVFKLVMLHRCRRPAVGHMLPYGGLCYVAAGPGGGCDVT